MPKENQTSMETDLVSRGLLLISTGRALDKRWEFTGDTKGGLLLVQEEQYEKQLLQWEDDANAFIAKQEVE